MQSWHIHIEGRVQGVGFRPFIYRLAKEMNLKGNVANTSNGVHIHILATKPNLGDFINRVKEEAPFASKISSIKQHQIDFQSFNSFEIIDSNSSSKTKLLITPDIALCSSCKKELKSPKDKRYMYAFTTCTECGPRYSIMKELPYDRATTTMDKFEMCPNCKSEFNTIEDRRFYSQTNSCPNCAIELKWLTEEPKHKDPIKHTSQLLKKGKIVAVKGIGGFLLLVDGTNKKAIQRLRERKNRPTKPFACLFKNVKQINQFAEVSKKESDCLQSNEAPIVLLKIKSSIKEIALKQIAPGLNRIGAMLPYAPILELISKKTQRPLIATSANTSGSPIVYKDEEALRLLSHIADSILTNNREIVFPQDDSVVVFTSKHEKKIVMRRGRGLAPSVDLPEGRLPNNVLAMGAEMKSAFAFTSNGNTYLSQYLGDTSNYESQETYEHTLSKLLKLIKPKIKKVVVDTHPNYHSALNGRNRALNSKLKSVEIQHHKAHFASVLTEHNLINQEEPVLGVIWDGLGFGDDGQLWGSEFFMYESNQFQRVHHLSYYPIISGNRMALDPPIATYAAMWPKSPGKVWERNSLSKTEINLFPQIAKNPKKKTTSMGRLFDAVAGLLISKKHNSYEGEAAVAIQVLAEKSVFNSWKPYSISLLDETLNIQHLLIDIDTDKKNLVPIEDIALKFHQTLVQYIALISDFNTVKKVAFSGGVFQNSLLIDMIIDRMSPYHELYFHEVLPPNDENIAIGQIALSQIKNKPHEFVSKYKSEKEPLCV